MLPSSLFLELFIPCMSFLPSDMSEHWSSKTLVGTFLCCIVRSFTIVRAAKWVASLGFSWFCEWVNETVYGNIVRFVRVFLIITVCNRWQWSMMYPWEKHIESDNIVSHVERTNVLMANPVRIIRLPQANESRHCQASCRFWVLHVGQ